MILVLSIVPHFLVIHYNELRQIPRAAINDNDNDNDTNRIPGAACVGMEKLGPSTQPRYAQGCETRLHSTLIRWERYKELFTITKKPD